jgi:hypothetical protein
LTQSEDEDVLLEQNDETPEEDERYDTTDHTDANNKDEHPDYVKVDEKVKGASRSKQDKARKQAQETKTKFMQEYVVYKPPVITPVKFTEPIFHPEIYLDKT